MSVRRPLTGVRRLGGQAKPRKRLPATPNQRRYLVAEAAGAGSYMIAMAHEIRGQVDRSRLTAAMTDLVSRHDGMRTGFRLDRGQAYAEIYDRARFQSHWLTLSDGDLATFRQAALPLVYGDVDVTDPGSLVRLVVAQGPTSWRLCTAIHHAVSDGFSRGLASTELLKLYAGEALAPTSSYYDYRCDPEEVAASEAYWTAFAERLPDPVRLPQDAALSADALGKGVHAERMAAFSPGDVRAAAKEMGATRFGLFAAAFALGLSRATGMASVSSSFQSAGRRSLDAPTDVFGPFSNILPIAFEIDLERPFGDVAAEASAMARQAVAHENAPVTEILGPRRVSPRVSLNIYPTLEPIVAGGLQIGPREFLDRRSELDLNLMWSEDQSVVRVQGFYDAALLSPDRAAAFLELQERLVERAIADPGAPLGITLERARGEQRAVIPAKVAVPADKPGRLHDPVLAAIRAHPDRTALRCHAGDWSYAKLGRRAATVADALRNAGAREGDRVAVFATRGPELVAAMLGVSLSGASFAIFDSGYPTARLAAQKDALDPSFALSADAHVPRELRGRMTLVDIPEGGTALPERNAMAPRSAAYHLFTSGTTGTPKLVTHPDAPLGRFIAWEAEKLGLADGAVVALLGGLSHDPMLRDVFLPLSTGGNLAIPSPETLMDPPMLRRFLDDTGVQVLHATPSLGRLILLGRPAAPLDRLRAIVWGGEALPGEVVRDWQQAAPQARQINLYGASETPQAALIHEVVSEDGARRAVPLGRPVPWVEGSLCDGNGKAIGPGEVGEICIAMPEAIGGAKDGGGAAVASRLHRTGDRGLMSPDGTIRYVGRSDDQIKIRGFRIELAEVTSAARRLAGIEEAVALVTPGDDPEIRLFVVVSTAGQDAASVRQNLSIALPSYMLPGRVNLLDALPLTPNGKVDRKALLALPAEADPIRIDDLTHRRIETPLEQKIAQIYARASGVAVTGAEQSLMDLGADSLSSVEARLALEALELELPEAWEMLPIAVLAAAKERAEAVGATPQIRGPNGVESFIPIRALAILMVVWNHMSTETLMVATTTMMMITGYAFARLQLPSILGDGRTGKLWATLLALVSAMVPVSLAVSAALSAADVIWHPSTVLPYANLARFLDELEGVRGERHIVLWMWFIHAYLQIFTVIGLILTFGRVRAWIAENPWNAAVLGFLAAEVLAISVSLSAGIAFGDVDGTGELLRRSPMTMAPLVMTGIMAAIAMDTRQRVLALSAIATHAVMIDIGPLGGEGEWTACLAMAAVLAFPRVRMPEILARVLLRISAASLIIYLTHMPIRFALMKATGESIDPLLATAIAVVLGMLLWELWKPLLRWLGVRKLAQMRLTI